MNPNSNVTPIESKQPQVAARFTITATLDGFPFTVEAEGKAKESQTWKLGNIWNSLAVNSLTS